MVAFIAYMQMFAPLFIDLYLPALPKMAEVFSASEILVNLTLAGFFLVFTVGISSCLARWPISTTVGKSCSLLLIWLPVHLVLRLHR